MEGHVTCVGALGQSADTFSRQDGATDRPPLRLAHRWRPAMPVVLGS